MPEPREIMIDCETLSLRSNAMVWQVGFAVIEDNAQAQSHYIDLRGWSALRKFDVDLSTIEFLETTEGLSDRYNAWFQRKVPLTAPIDLHGILLANMSKNPRDTIFWAKNAAFDFPILENMFIECGFSVPWHHRNKGCLYTMRIECERAARVTSTTLPEMPDNPVPHDAAFDALNQIEQLRIYRSFTDDLLMNYYMR